MKKLADISNFESITGGSPTGSSAQPSNMVFNEWVRPKLASLLRNTIPQFFKSGGREFADNRLMRFTGKNKKNYFASHLKGIRESHRLPYRKDKDDLSKGFDVFGNFCSNLQNDLTRQIDDIKVTYEPGCRAHALPEFNMIVLNPKDVSAATTAHELAHLLYNNPNVRNAMRPTRWWIPGRYGKYNDAGKVYRHDKLRGWVAGDDYAGKLYARGDNARKGFRSRFANDEYLSSFIGLYGQRGANIPLLYAMDMARLIRKINKNYEKMNKQRNKSSQTLRRLNLWEKN